MLGSLASIFSFITIDLARNDAIFTTGLEVIIDNTPPEVEFSLTNSSNTAMASLNIRYAIYDSAGDLIHVKSDTGEWDTLEECYFSPRGMTIGPHAKKFGVIAFTEIEKPPTDMGYAFVCAIFDGSFWFDKVRTEIVLSPIPAGFFGQKQHKNDVYYFSTPDCLPPEHFPTK